MNGNNSRALALQQAIKEYEQYVGERVTWLERLGDALTGLDERLDYSNILLINLLLLMGAPVGALPPPTVTPIVIPTPALPPPTVTPIVIPPPTPAIPPTIYPVRPVIPVATPIGTPVSKLESDNITSDTEYQTVAEWTIPDHYYGELFQISIIADDYTHALFRLVIASKEQWTDKRLMSALAQGFRGNELTERMLTQIQAKTDNAANPFYAYGEIGGKEYQK